MHKSNSFADFMKNKGLNNNSLKIDAIVEGIITNLITRSGGEEFFIVNIGLKSDGIVSVKDFSGDSIPKIGDKVKLVIVKNDGADGKIILSYSKMKRKATLEQLKSWYNNSTAVKAKVESEIENGYLVNLIKDVNAILPYEDAVSPDEERIKLEVGQEIHNVYISRLNKLNLNKIYVSLKSLNNVAVGDVVECFVKEIIDQDILVYLKNSNIKEGIIHKTDLDHKHKNMIDKQEMKHFKAKVTMIDDNNMAILSVKKIVHENWDNLKYNIGDEVDCDILQINEVGIIVGLDNGMEGFVHISEVDWNISDHNLREKFQISQKIKARVIFIDKQKKQIKLSIKQSKDNQNNNPFNKFIEQHKVGDIIEKAVVDNNNKSYGSFLFVILSPGVRSRLTPRDMHWNEYKAQESFANLKEGDEIKVQITNIDPSIPRISVSVKSMIPDVFNDTLKKLKVGSFYQCEVLESNYDGLKVKLLNHECEGIIYKNDLSKDKAVTRRSFQRGDEIKAKFIRVDDKDRTLILSIKAMENDIHKMAIKQHCSDEHINNKLLDFIQ